MRYYAGIVKTGYNVFLVAAIILFIYALFCPSIEGEAYRGSFESYYYNENWTIQGNHMQAESITLPVRIHADKGEMITVHNTLPQAISDGMSLAFRSASADVLIFIDGELRASYLMENVKPNIGHLPSGYVFVELSSSDALKDIDICVSPFYGGMTTINDVEYSYGNNIWFGHIKKNIAITFVAVSLILIGIVAGVVFAILHKKVDAGKSFLYLSQFIIVISLWLLSESQIRQLFLSVPYFTTVVAYIFVELITAYALLFVNELQGHYYQKIFLALGTLILVQIILNTILNFTGLARYHDTLIFSHAWSAATIITVMITLVLDVKSGRVKKYRIAAYGLVGVIICSVIEIALFYMSYKNLLGIPIGVGLLIMIGTTLTQTVGDIMDLKQQKDQNEMAAHIATEANHAKSDFLAQMSHEIRTPINAVLGMNEMILRESKEQQVLEYATNAYNAGKALLSIINDILDISKIEAGKMEIVNTDYDLYSLVSDCYNMTADRAEKKGLEFIYHVDEALPTKLNGDMFHIRQIVVNLLTNAIKYTDKGSVELSFTSVSGEYGFALQFSVKDTGIGLTEEAKEKLFGNFERFDIQRNRSVEGTGLGLSICKHLAEFMDGCITVESEYGKGSTFCCTIPQTVVDETPVGKLVINQFAKIADEKSDRVFTAKKAHILVVDDVEMNITVFKSLLKEHKMNIDSALSGRQCLEMVRKQKYDIIFMDHMMPEMDGMETYENMKTMEHRNKNTPVVMLTANAIMGEKEKYLAAGFVSYLTKPIQSDKLNDTLLEYLPEDMVVWTDAESEEADIEEEVKASDLEAVSPEAVDPDIIDVELGLTYAANSKEIYLEIVESYVRNGADNVKRLQAFFEEEAWKDYVILAHSLKSTSLTIGAKKLSELAKKLELAGKAEEFDTIKNENADLIALYKKVLAAGAGLLGFEESNPDNSGKDAAKNSDAEVKEITGEEFSDVREKMKKALASFDDEEIASVFDEISAYTYHGVGLAEKFAKVKELCEDFEYTEAADLAEKIFKELG